MSMMGSGIYSQTLTISSLACLNSDCEAEFDDVDVETDDDEDYSHRCPTCSHVSSYDSNR